MKWVQDFKKFYNELPANLKKFLLRGTVLFLIWILLYNLLLKPKGVPDRQLTHVIVVSTAKVLTWFYPKIDIKSDCIIYINNKEAIEIAPACNGLELLVLYVGFLLCIPTGKRRFWKYAIGGTAIVIVLNILRCAGLAAMFYYEYSLADFAHHYLFKLIIYAVIFYMWVLYSKKYLRHE
jgi:exosortase/archaeosortase family protein